LLLGSALAAAATGVARAAGITGENPASNAKTQASKKVAIHFIYESPCGKTELPHIETYRDWIVAEENQELCSAVHKYRLYSFWGWSYAGSTFERYLSKTQFQLCEPLNYFVLPRDDLRLPGHGQREHAHGHRTERQHQPHIRFACGNAKSANQPSHNQGVS
jgi:hypothetical protein